MYPNLPDDCNNISACLSSDSDYGGCGYDSDYGNYGYDSDEFIPDNDDDFDIGDEYFRLSERNMLLNEVDVQTERRSGESGDYIGAGNETYDTATLGMLVKRLKLRGGKGGGSYDGVGLETGDESKEGGLANVGVRCDAGEMWLTLPNELMVLILAKLPFSSLRSVRSVCKKLRALAVYPDANFTVTRNVDHAVPICLIHTNSIEFACYDPLSHEWRRLPTSFASFLGTVGVNSSQARLLSCAETRILASSGGLLVLDYLDMGLWVVNPMNKSERRLPPHPTDKEKLFIDKVHLHVDGSNSSEFKIIIEMRHPDNNFEFDCSHVHFYESETDSWTWRAEYHCDILSIVEFQEDIYSLVLDSEGMSSILQHLIVYRYHREHGTVVTPWETKTLPTPSRRLRGGQLFVRAGKLCLGGVTTCNLSDGQRGSIARIWELNFSPMMWKKTEWKELRCMPIELGDVLSCERSCRVHVHVCDDCMWVRDSGLSKRLWIHYLEMAPKNRSCGVMCHIPSNTWWKVPNFWDSPNFTKYRWNPGVRGEVWHNEREGADTVGYTPFLFSPRVNLKVQGPSIRSMDRP